MALIKCNECGKEISDKATICIHCGCPVELKIKCSECGKEIKSNDKICKNCLGQIICWYFNNNLYRRKLLNCEFYRIFLKRREMML